MFQAMEICLQRFCRKALRAVPLFLPSPANQMASYSLL
jgi:hypothetical protein